MGPGGRVPDEAVCVEPRHFACHHGESRDQSQSAAQSPEAVSLEALPYGAAPSRCASCATPGRCERRTWSGGNFRATTALDGGRQWDTYLISQAMPSRSRSSSSRYPGSPRYKGAAPASFAFLQLGKYMLSCLGSGTGAGAAAPPPA